MELNDHAKARLEDIAARKQRESEEVRVANTMRLIQRNLDMMVPEPELKLKALLQLTCMFIVTEHMHLPWREVRWQAFTLFRKVMEGMHIKLEQVVEMEQADND